MFAWEPLWWDTLTLGRLAALSVAIVAWAAVGWFAAPRLWVILDDITHGYVRWMQAEFDKMFLEVSATLCFLSILASVTARC